MVEIVGNFLLKSDSLLRTNLCTRVSLIYLCFFLWFLEYVSVAISYSKNYLGTTVVSEVWSHAW